MTEYAGVFNAFPEVSDPAKVGAGWIDIVSSSPQDNTPEDLTWFEDREEIEEKIQEEIETQVVVEEETTRLLKREDGEIEVLE